MCRFFRADFSDFCLQKHKFDDVLGGHFSLANCFVWVGGKNLFYYSVPLDYGPYVSTHRRPIFVYLPQLYFTITTVIPGLDTFLTFIAFFAVRSRKQQSNKRYSFLKIKNFRSFLHKFVGIKEHLLYSVFLDHFTFFSSWSRFSHVR